MRGDARQLALDFGGSASGLARVRPLRLERREPSVRLVEWAPFPRVSASQRFAVGFTRDVSATGMCLAVDTALPEGTLLRVIVRGVDGRPALDGLARVRWAREEDGGFCLGLALLGEVRRGMIRVRRGGSAREVA
jgi:hypothetical protein